MAVHETGMPTHCSSCFGQDTKARHVDFDAAWDGPVFNEDGLKVPIDDLILCEHCIAEAARILGWVPASDDETATKAQRLEAELVESRKIRADLSRRLDAVRGAISEVDPQLRTVRAHTPRKVRG